MGDRAKSYGALIGKKAKPSTSTSYGVSQILKGMSDRWVPPSGSSPSKRPAPGPRYQDAMLSPQALVAQTPFGQKWERSIMAERGIDPNTPLHAPQAYITNEPINGPQYGVPIQSAAPMPTDQYEAWLKDRIQRDNIDRSIMSDRGQAQQDINRRNNVALAQRVQRINNQAMPAEIGSPGLKGGAFELFRQAIGDKRAL